MVQAYWDRHPVYLEYNATCSVSSPLEDASECAQIFIGAFIVDSLHNAVFKGMPFEEQVAIATELWPRIYHFPASFTQLVKDTDRGETIAFARRTISNCQHVMKKLRGDELDLSIETTAPPLIMPRGVDEKLVSRFVAQAKEKKIKHMDSRPFMRECARQSSFLEFVLPDKVVFHVS